MCAVGVGVLRSCGGVQWWRCAVALVLYIWRCRVAGSVGGGAGARPKSEAKCLLMYVSRESSPASPMSTNEAGLNEAVLSSWEMVGATIGLFRKVKLE